MAILKIFNIVTTKGFTVPESGFGTTTVSGTSIGAILPPACEIGKFMCDTSAQVNIAGHGIFDILGIPEEEWDEHLIDSKVRINGVGGSVSMAKELRVRIHSLKTKDTVPTVFYVSKDFKTNIMSEQTLYQLKYLSEDMFSEDELYEADGQDNYITRAQYLAQ